MTKTELIAHVAQATGLPKSHVAEAVDGTFKTIIAAMASGETVNIQDFGWFKPVLWKGRIGWDYVNKKHVRIPSRYRPSLRFTTSVAKVVREGNK